MTPELVGIIMSAIAAMFLALFNWRLNKQATEVNESTKILESGLNLIDRLEKRLAEAEEELKELRKIANDGKAEIENLLSGIHDRNIVIDSLKDRISDLEQENKSLRDKIKVIEDKNGNSHR